MFRHSLHKLLRGLVLALWGLAVQADGMSAPQINYILHCQGCHLADGSGTAGKVPALKNAAGRFLYVPGGREYLVQVPGTAQSALTDSEVAGVLNWILLNFSETELPADFIPYSTVEISRVRPNPLADVSAARARLMAEISAGTRSIPTNLSGKH
ncbi:MAG TPA: cytochrome c [Xanthomonadales bacterium]|nr:cytochrome c [Xanthomonadales bacterium]